MMNDDEERLYRHLLAELVAKRSRNRLRSAYMDGKHALDRLPPTAPPYLSQLRTVLGWPAKAVEMLARRVSLERFALPESASHTLSDELHGVLDANNYWAEASQSQVSALVHSTVFSVVSAGQRETGEAGAIISHVSALDATGIWNPRTRCFDAFLWVHEWGKPGPDGLNPAAATLMLPHTVIRLQAGREVERARGLLRMPVTHKPYKPRLDRPFGSSRISRPVMSLTDAAVRTLIRAEGNADFYGTPWFMIYGPDESAFQKSSWQMIMDRVNAIPDNEDAANPRAKVEQFQQASQQPHVDMLQALAGLFAGETNIPVSSLGVGLSQANPHSAESYMASREDLIAEAEDAQASWSHAHTQLAIWAWQTATNTATVPGELAGLAPVWRDPRYTSRAAAADAAIKLVTAFPWMAQSAVMVEQLGFDKTATERLMQDMRRGSALNVLAGYDDEVHA